MRSIKQLAALLLLVTSFIVSTGWSSATQKTNSDAEENVIVVINYKAQAEKGAKAIMELTQLIDQVKEEPDFVSITMHVDPNDDTNILLYEEWENADYYKTAHMNTPHIQAFINNSRNFLAGPPEISFWEVEKVFK